MLSPRKGLILVLGLVVLFFLYTTISSSSEPQAVHASTSTEQDNYSSSRSYPPPPPPRGKKSPNDQQIITNISAQPLRKQLEYFFPYEIDTKFPAYIWQTWKVNPSSTAFEDRLRPLEASWTDKHPGFVHEVVVDDAAHQLVKYLYASVPKVVEAWTAMPVPVLKADFFRYLILLARGGIYSDIDTQALKSAVNWLPENFDQSSIGLIVGIEADPDREDWNKWYARRIQFCQWTIQAKPGHPVLRDIVATITELALEMKEKNQLKAGREPTVKSVMEFTGPGVWTDAIFSYFNNPMHFKTDGIHHNITVKDFFGITSQKKVGDVVVLPITSFSPGVGQMGAGELDDEMAFVHHEFDGSWKPANERIGEQNKQN